MPSPTTPPDRPPPDHWVAVYLRNADVRATPARCLVIRTLATYGPLPLPALITAVCQQLPALRPATIKTAAHQLTTAGLLSITTGSEGEYWRLADHTDTTSAAGAANRQRGRNRQARAAKDV